MNNSSYKFTLDIHSTQSQISIPVKFGDTARELNISLADGAVPYVIADGSRAVFSAKKADGNVILNDCVIEDNARIRYQFTDQTANVEGVTHCEIRLYGGDNKLITSPRFIMVVDERIGDIEVASMSEMTTIDNIVEAELERADSELARADAEAERASAEAERVSAEANRAEIYEALKSIDESATPSTVALRDADGCLVATTPDHEWGQDFSEDVGQKVATVEAVNNAALAVLDSVTSSIEETENRILEQVVTPGVLDDALADALSGKLDTYTGSGSNVYIAEGGTQKMQPMVYNKATVWSVAQRNGSGQLVIGEPTADGHAATKKYVDDEIAKLRKELTGS